MRRVTILASFLLATLVPAVALADDDDPPPLPAASAPTTTTVPATGAPTVDAVHLRNGGLYRGRVTEIVPGDHVTVVVEKGETKRVPWTDVDRVIVASTPVPAPPTSSSPSPPTTAPMVGPRARVHITTKRQVILYRRPSGTTSWVQACTSPCGEELPIGDTYRLTGNGVAQSKEFHLEASPGGTVDVVVDPPSVGGMVFGGLTAGAGFMTGYVGLLMALVGAGQAADGCGYYSSTTSTSSYCENRKKEGEDVRDAGLVALGIGTALTAVGVVIFLNSATTDISQRSAGHNDASREKPLDAFLRQPTWKSARTSSEAAAAAPPAAFPVLFTTTF